MISFHSGFERLSSTACCNCGRSMDEMQAAEIYATSDAQFAYRMVLLQP